MAGFLESILPSAALLAFLLPSCNAAQVQHLPPSRRTFDQIAALAKEAREANDLARAIRLYQQAVGLRPRWAEGWWSLGTLEYDRDQYAKAAEDFEKLIALQPDNGTAHAMLGLCEFELGKGSPALKNLLEAKRLGVLDDAELRRVTLYHLALLQLRAGRFGDTQESLTLLVQAGVENEEVILLNGEAALKVRPEQAPQVGTSGRHVLLRVGKAEMLKVRKKFAGAKQEYLSLVAEYPDYPNLHFAFGRFLLDAGEPDEGIPQFQKELQANPRNVNALLAIAAVRYRTDSADGVKYAEQAVKINPGLPFAHYLLGLLYLDSGNTTHAISQLEIARRGFANKPEVYFALGNAYTRAGRKAEAAKARAEFRRLQALEEKEPGPAVYGQQPQRLPQEMEEPQEPK